MHLFSNVSALIEDLFLNGTFVHDKTRYYLITEKETDSGLISLTSKSDGKAEF